MNSTGNLQSNFRHFNQKLLNKSMAGTLLFKTMHKFIEYQ